MKKSALICCKHVVEVTKAYRSCSVLRLFFFLNVFLHCSVLLGSYILSLCSSDFLSLLYGVHRLNIPTAVPVCSREWSPVLASTNFLGTVAVPYEHVWALT